MLALFVILPLLAGILLVYFANYKNAKYIALAASIVSLLMLPFFSSSETISWLSIANLQIDIAINTSKLNLMLLYLVAFMSPVIFFYSFGYMGLPGEQKRYYIEMLGFETAMLLFAMSGSFVTLFIGWEFLSMTSYLLIGFWYDREKAVRAARKVVSIIMLGDISLFASMVLFLVGYHTLVFSQILANISPSAITFIAGILLLVAIFTKSAQFPFHEWLSDAMEGPTPVSAMLHSTTMVKAGVFAVMILLPLFIALKLNYVILTVGMFTALIATLDALRETHIKKVLAYSTIQELSLMLVALGANAFLAAIYFFIAQSFYKALLFFSAGSVMTATNKEDLRELGGLRVNRPVFVSTLFGVLALAGFIPFDGFFASASIASSFSTNLVIYALISIIGMLTSLFIFRWLTLCSREQETERERIFYKGLPRSMIVSSAFLAALSLAASYLFFVFPSLFSGVRPSLPLAFSTNDALLETGLAAIGAAIAIEVYRKSRPVKLGKIANFMQTTWIFNLFYWLFAIFFYLLADGFFYFDLYLDDFLADIGLAFSKIGYYSRLVATGRINTYIAIFAIGIALLIIAVV